MRSRVGISSVQAGAGVAPGNYTVSVLQATAGATRTGTSPLAASTVIDGTNNTLNLELDGVATPVTIAASGTYDAAGLLGAVQTASTPPAAASRRRSTPPAVSASRRPTRAPPPRSRSWAAARSPRSASPTLSAATGTDGSIQIGTEPAVTVTSAGTGASVAVAPATGNLDGQARRRTARRRRQGRRGLHRRPQPGECRGRDQRRQRRRQRGRHQGRRRSVDPAALIEQVRHRQRDGARRHRVRRRRRAAPDVGRPGRQDHDRFRSRGLFGRGVGEHVHRRAQRSDAHRHRRVGDPRHRQREPQRRAPPRTASATHRRRQQPAGRHQAADRATTRRPRRPRR